MSFWDARESLWSLMLHWYAVMGCRVWEDMSALCGHIGHSVPW